MTRPRRSRVLAPAGARRRLRHAAPLLALVLLAAPGPATAQDPADARGREIAATRATLKALRAGLDDFLLVHGRYPYTEEGVVILLTRGIFGGPYIAHSVATIDAWGRPFVYRAPGTRGGRREYDLFSLGPDGREGTADDVE